ncbi:UDP-glycosyltransferase 72B2 [Triticum urartu]|uniref:UDP-glycosyltransferase 72B2 n=1 Tax=Triticum urartu TaxID=4572 RepID=M7ZV95_TRIUA|nr:UDP-glycosyltransferase 72B2 [Triticum urartu]
MRRAHDTLRLTNPALRAFLRSLPAPAHALLLDMFCVDALDVAADLALPAYFFFASAASDLAVFLNLPYLYPGLPSFRDTGDALVRCPGMPPIRAVDMLVTVQDKESDLTKVRLYQFKRIAEARGVLAIMSGLPMICWPLYAEQAQNKVFMVEEMKIAVALEGYEKGTVKAEEIEAKLRLVMGTEEGGKLREMLSAARKMASDAIGDGGSSEVAFARFLSDLENGSMENGGCNN